MTQEKIQTKTAAQPTITNITLTCGDNHKLAATLFEPTSQADKSENKAENKIKAAVMVAPATGIKRRFYQNFAIFLAQNGFGVITFDNRGIGDSLTLNGGNISQSQASLIDWGRLDMSAVFASLKSHFPNTSYHLVGHSAGGQLVGIMEGSLELSSIFNFACSSGCIDNMDMPYQRKARFFMRMFVPFSNMLFGHGKAQWLGMGEPLPAQVAADWAAWCLGAGYIDTELQAEKAGKVHKKTGVMRIGNHYYDALDCPSMWLNAPDDDIANDKNVNDMTRVFTKLPVQRLKLKPSDYGLDDIGHMKFFSRKSKALWDIALDWLQSHST